MVTFNELLRQNGIDPNEVSLLRHKVEASWLRDRSVADFERYQLTQKRAAGFSVNPATGPASWLLCHADKIVGLYEVALHPEMTVDWPDPLTGRAVGADRPSKSYEAFETTLSPIMSEYIDQLYVMWNGSEQSWAQHAGGNDKQIASGVEAEVIATVSIPASLNDVLAATTRETLMSARIGQAWFRKQLLGVWHGKCALTGLALPGLLRASHIKPWRFSNNAERLDPANGLLLAVHVDALFDSHLISFAGDGSLIVSRSINAADLAALGIPERTRLRGLHPRTLGYLRHHRARLARG